MEPRSVAADTFPERPPPQDPSTYQRVMDWLHGQARGPQGPAQLPPSRKPETPITWSERDPVKQWANWRAAPLVKARDEAPENAADMEAWLRTGTMPERMASRQREEFAGGGPIGLGAPGGSMAGWVRGSDFHPVTGMPRYMTAGPGPKQGQLPPGQRESPIALQGTVSGEPGGWVNVGWLGGEQQSTLPGRAAGTTAGGQMAKGPGLMETIKLRNEAIPYLQEYGVQGVTYSPLSSGADVATGGQMGRAGRNKLNEVLIGNKSVETGYGPYAIPFREPEFYPKPDWYQGPPPEELLKANQWRQSGTTPHDQALSEMTQRPTGPTTTPEQARRARAEYLAGDYAPTSEELVMLYPEQSAREAAMRVRENRARRRESLNRAETTGQEQRAQAGHSAAVRRSGMLNRAEESGRSAQAGPQYANERPLMGVADDEAHFHRALSVMQTENQRLGRSLTAQEIDSIMRNTRLTPTGTPQGGTANWALPDVQRGIVPFRHFRGRDPQTPQEVLDYLAESERLGRYE